MVKSIILSLILACCFSLHGQSNVALLSLDHPIDFSVGFLKRNNHKAAIPFSLEGGLIYTMAQVNGQDEAFILDTGAPLLVISDKTTIESEQTAGYSAGGKLTVGWTNISNLEWAGKQHHNQEAAVLDLSHFHVSAGKSIYGLIGYDMYKDKALMIDYQQEVMHLFSPKALKAAMIDAPVAAVSMSFYEHLPVIQIYIQGNVFNFAIDTGASCNLLSESAFDVLDKDNLSFLATKELQGLDQQVQEVNVVQINDMQLADDLDFTDEFLVCNLDHLNQDRGIEIHGLLGTTFLSQFLSCLNYPERNLLLWAVND